MERHSMHMYLLQSYFDISINIKNLNVSIPWYIYIYMQFHPTKWFDVYIARYMHAYKHT